MANDNAERLPWKNDVVNFTGCNFAYADLTTHLPQMLAVAGRLHAQTFVAASGAIAGFAAQQTLLMQKPNFSIDALNETSPIDGLFIVRSPRGDRYIYGDPLKLMIFSNERTPTPITARLWEWAAGGAVAAGLDKSQLPLTVTMWENVNRSIQTGLDGMPSVPKNHWPHQTPAQLLERVWPIARKLIVGKGSGALAPPGIVVVEPHWWPTITGMATSAAIREVKSVLDPRTALLIAMESAIFTLKIDPTKFEKIELTTP
jgi:hypothetical protein